VRLKNSLHTPGAKKDTENNHVILSCGYISAVVLCETADAICASPCQRSAYTADMVLNSI
jgi:hypothetical protein